jgi:hypothetical protein
MDNLDLVEEYAYKIAPHLEQAQKAYGSRSINSPAHIASREYTRLLVEYYEKGGQLSALSRKIKVSYPGLRRRVITSNVDVSTIKPEIKVPLREQDIAGAAFRVKTAKSMGVDFYHDQLRKEYEAGVSLSRLAREIGLSSAAPLYYGVQRSLQRNSN